jgi:2-keto-4-pentenoate hydratase/2-oxohepta-3-ene-1,7-dioic acid hydratase in catechol pathway
MKLLRYRKGNQASYGVLEGDTVYQIDSPFKDRIEREQAAGSLKSLKILAPCEPTKIICAAKNYPWGENPANPPRPLLFFKPPSSVIGPGEDVVYPSVSQQLIFESELVIVMGRVAHNVAAKDALRYVLGYTCGNDVTAYDFILRDNATFHGKSFDTFCPLGPHIETDLDPDDTTITCRVNGQVKASSPTQAKYYPCAELISFISEIMTLFPGDIIMTGTPDIGTIHRGDVVEVDIAGIGVLRNQVV